MRDIRFPRRESVIRLAASAALSLTLAAAFTGPVNTQFPTWAVGDVFVGVGHLFFGSPADHGTYLVFSPNGVPKHQALVQPDGGLTWGCAVDPGGEYGPGGDLWTAGYWTNRLTRFSHVDGSVSELDLSEWTWGRSKQCDPIHGRVECPAVESIVFKRDGSFLVGTAYGLPGNDILQVDPVTGNVTAFDVDTNGRTQQGVTTPFRGSDYLDLARDQHTIYYAPIDDSGAAFPVIKSFDLTSGQQNADIVITANGVPFGPRLLAFRLLPPGDGTGGFLIATSLHVYRVGAPATVTRPDGSTFVAANIIRDYIGASMGNGVQEYYVALTLAPDSRSFWTASFSYATLAPSKLFKFDVSTGRLLQGPIDLGTAPDQQPRYASGLCAKLEYAAGNVQPSEDECANLNTLAPSLHHLCQPLPIYDCSVGGADAQSPVCHEAAGPEIVFPAANDRLTHRENEQVSLQFTTTFPVGSSLTYTLHPALPSGLSLNASTGLVTGRIGYNADDGVDWLYTLTVRDNANPTAVVSGRFVWDIVNVNAPPSVTVSPSSLTVGHGVPIPPIALSGSDQDPADSVGFVPGAGFPSWLALTSGPVVSGVSRTATITGTPALAALGVTSCSAAGICGGPVTVQVHGSDGTESVQISVTLNITNQPPVLAPIAPQRAKPGTPLLPIPVVAVDPNRDAVSFSMTAVPGLTINAATGVISGVPAAEGIYPVTVTADDGRGPSGIATTSFVLQVVNNAAPACSGAVAAPLLLWPPNHKFVPISIGGLSDTDGDSLSVVVTHILQDEPTLAESGLGKGSGNTSIDGEGVGTAQARVRAERAGTGDGRVYEIRFTANDGRGGVCDGSVTVGVPHSKAHLPPVDSLARYDATVAGGAALAGRRPLRSR